MFKYFVAVIFLSCTINAFCDPNLPKISDPNITNDAKTTQEEIKNSEIDEFYSQYELVLSKYVNEQGLVNYPKLRRYRLELIPQVLEFSTLMREEYNEWSDDQRKCFWINAYNFYVLKSVIDNYPIEVPFYRKIWWPENSVVHIDGFYDKNYVVVMGLEYTLDEIEDMAVNQFGDPNTCFALADGTLGAPPLAQKPFRANNFDIMIQKQIKRHLSRDVGFEVNFEEKTLLLAELFDEHAQAFIKKYGKMKKFRAFQDKIQAAFNFLDNHAPEPIIEDIQIIDTDFEISFRRRNWRFYMNLNQIGIK